MKSEECLRYNFIFIFADSDYWYSILGKEIFNSEHSRVYLHGTNASWLKKLLFHYHWSYRLNSKIKVPFKSLWYKDIYNQDFKNYLPIAFVFVGGNNIRYARDFCEYVKKRNSENKIVVMHSDIIAKHIGNYEYDVIKDMADLIITYDKEEAIKYKINYLKEDTYSKIIDEPATTNYKNDVYFLGAAKDRYDKIIDAFYYLKRYELRCKFVLTGVSKNEQLDVGGIEYSNGISYEDNIRNVIESKCILELIQGESSATTLREKEAIAYRRRFITDCKSCDKSHFNDGQLQIIDKIEDINIEMIKGNFNPDAYPQKIDLNPIKRLFAIQNMLDTNDK